MKNIIIAAIAIALIGGTYFGIDLSNARKIKAGLQNKAERVIDAKDDFSDKISDIQDTASDKLSL